MKRALSGARSHILRAHILYLFVRALHPDLSYHSTEPSSASWKESVEAVRETQRNAECRSARQSHAGTV